MLLSIITINRNNAQGLAKTLLSVASQTCKDFEHIIIDGASTDDSVEVIKQYVENIRHKVRWLSEPDSGIYNAMNKGIRMAEGEYIQILNSGDILAADDVVEKMFSALKIAEEMNAEQPVPILYGNMIKQWPNGKRIVDSCYEMRNTDRANSGIAVRLTEWTLDDFITGTINHDPTYIRSDLFEKYGLYDEELKICSDWKWFVKSVIFGGEKVFYAPMEVTVFDMTGVSETNSELREKERWNELGKFFPEAVLKDYKNNHSLLAQVKRLKRHHAWGLVNFAERVLFKLEKWHILKH